VLVIFFPETLPSRQHTAQSGLKKIIYTPIIRIVGRKIPPVQALAPLPNTPKPKKFQNPLLLLVRYNIALLLLLNGTSFLVFFGAVTSLSAIFEEVYPFLDEFHIGLCFLAMGGGMVLGTGLVGWAMDWRYQVEVREFRKRLVQKGELEKRLEAEGVKDVDKLQDFPLERARLKYLSELVVLLAGCTAGYGWCLEKRVPLAVPLIFQVIMGLICIAVMNTTMTLMIDLAPGQGSAVAACSNLVRCVFSATIISVIQPLINAIGVGWTYVLLGAVALTSLPWFYLEIKFGPRLRAPKAGPAPSTIHTPAALKPQP